jgi:hypothetical protein
VDVAELLAAATAGPAVAVSGGYAWRAKSPTSFWLTVGFPAVAARVRGSWASVADSCGLADSKYKRVKHSDGSRGTVSVPLPPRLLLRPTRQGFRAVVRMRPGQEPADYVRVTSRLAHAWRMHAVRVVDSSPGKVLLTATHRDPLADPAVPDSADDLLAITVGTVETGGRWVLDFRTVPHWLVSGATQSGKSTLVNALIRGLAPQPVALVGIDLKGGLEMAPYEARFSALATTRTEALGLLRGLLDLLGRRQEVCRAGRVRNVWELDEDARPVPVVVFVDEVAEVFLAATKDEKAEVAEVSTALLRLAQLGRAFGIHLVVAGQRVGADLGPGVTALRAQLSGRVCHRVNDPETATMTLGDLHPDALDAARAIAANEPGVAVVGAEDGSWHRARSTYVTTAAAEQAATAHAHRTPAWDALLADRRTPAEPAPAPTPVLT